MTKIELNIPDDLYNAIAKLAESHNLSPEELAIRVLEGSLSILDVQLAKDQFAARHKQWEEDHGTGKRTKKNPYISRPLR